MKKTIDELFMEVYKICQEKKLCVPFLFKPYDSNRKKVDENLWCASAESRIGTTIGFIGLGKTQEDALLKLKEKLLEG